MVLLFRKHITNKHLSGPNALPAVGSQTPNASVVYLDSSQTTDNQIPSTTASTTTIFQNSVTGVESTSSNTNMPELGEEYQLMYTNGEGAVVSLNGVDGGSSIQGQHYVEIQQSQQPENAIQFQWDVAPTEVIFQKLSVSVEVTENFSYGKLEMIAIILSRLLRSHLTISIHVL